MKSRLNPVDLYDSEEEALIIEVLGVEPPCNRCRVTYEVVSKTVTDLQLKTCSVSKLNAYSPQTVGKYGVVFTPAVAIDGRIVISGRVPSTKELKELLARHISPESGQKSKDKGKR